MLLTNMLGSLLRDQALNDQMRWNQVRAEMQMPYPLDEETAAAIDAAKRHHVLTWEVLEEGDDVAVDPVPFDQRRLPQKLVWHGR